jgi:protein-tyrosine phosphatase
MEWIELEGAVNARDLGGLATEDGQRTARGQLLRADNLQGPAPLDAVPTVHHAHHPVLPELGANTDVIADALLSMADQDKSRYPADPVCGHYLGYLEDRPDQIVAALRSIACADGAALVHCAAGKDRTGVVVALALTVAGVRPQDIVDDYAASGDRTEAILARLRASATYARDIDRKPAAAHRVRPETMTAFLEQMESRHGGVARWLADHGFSDDEQRLLRAKLRDRPDPAVPSE